MAISKIIYKTSAQDTGTTWMDATPATAAAADITSPKTAMLANGVMTTGTGSGGGGGGTSDYNDLTNKPQINSVTLSGNKSLNDIGVASASDMETVKTTLGLSSQVVDYGTDNPLVINSGTGKVIDLEFDTAQSYLVCRKNIYDTATHEVTGLLAVDLPVRFPAGDYVLSANTVSTDTEVGYSWVAFYDTVEDGYVTGYTAGVMEHDVRTSSVMSASGSFDRIFFFALDNYASSQGVTTTFSNIQIELGDTATPYTAFNGEVRNLTGTTDQITTTNETTIIFTDDGSDVHAEGMSGNPVIPAFNSRITALEQPLKDYKILVLGDSIWSNDRTDGVTDFLAQYSGATVYNGAVGGTRITGDRTQYEAIEYKPFDGVNLVHALMTSTWTDQDASVSQLASYVSEETLPMLKSLDVSTIDIVILSFGGNDFTGSKTIAQIQTAFETVISEILTSYPSIRIVIVTPPWRKFESTDGDVYTNSNSNTLRDVCDGIASGAKAKHICCINALDELPWRAETATQYLDSDAVHPNTEGNKILAHVVNGKLRSMF